jgi:hypothetical protein
MKPAAIARHRITLFIACATLAACSTPAGTVKPDGVVDWADHAPETSAAELSLLKGVDEYRSANQMIRIVKIDGQAVPGQFAAAEGADAVSLRPGRHEVKLLWVHADGGQDWFTYTNVQVDTRPNCVYRFNSSVSPGGKAVRFDVSDAPLSTAGNQDCGKGLVGVKQVAG